MAHKKGSVQVSLIWDNPPGQETDLDLYVTAPSGETLSYRNRTSACGGFLDTDAQHERNPVENITWTSSAPSGEYRVQVRNCNGETKKQFKVRIVQDGWQICAKVIRSSAGYDTVFVTSFRR